MFTRFMERGGRGEGEGRERGEGEGREREERRGGFQIPLTYINVKSYAFFCE